MPNRDAMARSGMTWPVNGLGRPGTTTSHVCVERTCRPSGRLTVRRFNAIWRLGTGTPSCMKMDVALVSSMPCDGSMFTWRGLLVSWARCGSSRVLRDNGDTFDVITVTSSSIVSEINLVGFKGAETKSLNLYAIDAFAPPRHILPRPPPNAVCFCGNCVLCSPCPFVQGPYATKLAEFSRVYASWWLGLRHIKGHVADVCPSSTSNPQEKQAFQLAKRFTGKGALPKTEPLS
jgi:hypothetical protein